MTWRARANEIIGEVHGSLPADADLKARKAALKAARPGEYSDTSWGRKVWQQAQQKYLSKHGLKPRGWSKLPPTPLEQAIAESGARR